MFSIPYILLGVCTLAMTAQAFLAYGKTLSSLHYYLIGWLVSSIACFSWLSAAKSFGDDKAGLFQFAAVWDVAIALTWLIIPALFFSVGLNNTKLLGLGIMLVGVIILNWA